VSESEGTESGPTWVVIPTYDEAGNVEAIARAVAGQLGPGDRILFVDDGSPDGTGEILDRLATGSGEIEVLHRPVKDGLGGALVAGFRRALESGAGLVVQMDADFSHDPASLPDLIAASRQADLVIGSRYVAGGGVQDWGAFRRVLSRGGSLYSAAVLGLPQRDLTGGFKCWRAEALGRIDLDSVGSAGYSFQVELTWRAVRAGLTVVEVPIVFRERTEGRSKMSSAIVVEAAWRVPALRLRGDRRRGRRG
jgi:dolichol-phosphate mannosyltransferase